MNLSGLVLDPATVERVAWTLLHSLWEGIAIAVVLAFAMLSLRRASAQSRYVALCVGLLVLLAAPVVTFWYLAGTFDDPGPLVIAAGDTARPSPTDGATLRAKLSAAIQPWTPHVLAAWLAGIVLLALRHIFAWLWLQRLLVQHTLPLDERWRWLSRVARDLSLPHVGFLETRFLDVPATVGWLKPVVLIPAAALSGLTVSQLEAIVAHELAHVRRRDYLVNLLQTLGEVLMFYHPVAWWISNRIREERENCCDDIASAVTGGGGRAFADALLALEERRAATPAFAMAATGGLLWRRMARLVGADARAAKRGLARPIAVLCSLTLIAIAAAQVFGSAVAVRPDRNLEDVRSLCGHVYEVLAIHPVPIGAATATSLADALRGLDHGRLDGDALDRVAAAALVSRPDEIADAALPDVHADDQFGHQSAMSWPYGTVAQRTVLTRELWSRARRLHAADPRRAAQLARASLLLASQDNFMFGMAPMNALLREPDFGDVARVTPQQLARLRRHVADHQMITGTCLQLLARVERGLSDARPEPDQAAWAAPARDDLAEVIRICGARYDVQLRVAGASARLAQRYGITYRPPADLARFSHLNRWVAEASLAPSGSAVKRGPKRMTMKQLEAIRRDLP